MATEAAQRSLAEALTELQQGGLKLIFSDRVVLPSMRVESEPEGLPAQKLRRLLEPHGLEARPGANDWLIVARASKPPITPPVAPGAAADEARVVRVSEAMVVTPRIRLPVHVLDEGRPVRGLRAEDFELFVGGKRQEILDLETVDLALLSGDEPSGTVPAIARRHFLLVFDTGLEDLASLNRAREVAQELIGEGLHSSDLVGLATLSELRRPHFALAFSPDREAASASIEVVTGRAPDRVVTDPWGSVVRATHSVTDRRDERAEARARRSLRPDDVQGREAIAERLDGKADLEILARRTDRAASVARLIGFSTSLAELAGALRNAPGRKQVVFFSEGFDNSLLTGFGGSSESERLEIEAMNRAVESGEVWKVDSDQRYGNEAALSNFERMLTEFTRSNSVVHAVNTRVAENDGRPATRSRDGLVRLATRTGGLYLSGAADLGQAMALLRDTTSVTYVLSFAPPVRKKARPDRVKLRLRNGVAGRVLHSPSLFEGAYSEVASPVGEPIVRVFGGADTDR